MPNKYASSRTTKGTLFSFYRLRSFIQSEVQGSFSEFFHWVLEFVQIHVKLALPNEVLNFLRRKRLLKRKVLKNSKITFQNNIDLYFFFQLFSEIRLLLFLFAA